MFDVVAIGEVLIDFTPAGISESGDSLFAKKPGGAPANVLAANSLLGGKTAFIGKVGKDSFGYFLKKTLEDIQIDTSGLVMTTEVNTTLAFVHLDETGDRSFSFYRNPGADIMLKSEEVNMEIIKSTKIMHFGSVSVTDEPCRSATINAVKAAKSNGKIISYDPNFREPLWKSKDEAIKQMISVLPLVDIIKVSEEELEMLTEEKDLVRGSEILSRYGITLVMVTLGSKGAFYKVGKHKGIKQGHVVKTIDTNGAGDAFTGAVHYQVKDKSLDEIRTMSKDEIERMIDFANAVGALTTAKSGAITALPTMHEVEALLNRNV
jgi:fructokinase